MSGLIFLFYVNFTEHNMLFIISIIIDITFSNVSFDGTLRYSADFFAISI